MMGPQTQSPREVPFSPGEMNTVPLLPLNELPKARTSMHLRVLIPEDPGA